MELFFRFIIPAADWPKWIYNDEYKIMQFDPSWQKEGYHAIGRWGAHAAKWRVNNFGWLNKTDYDAIKTKPRICVIGDSFVEAIQVNYGEAFHEILQERLQKKMQVYSFGTSGAPLSHYFYMAKYVDEKFNPNIFIFNTVFNDFDESIYDPTASRKNIWTYRPLSDSTFSAVLPMASKENNSIKRFSKHSAVLRYLHYNLKLGMKWQHLKHILFERIQPAINYEGNIDTAVANNRKSNIKKVIAYILAKIKQEFPNKRIIFTLDALRFDIYEGTSEKNNILWMRDQLQQACFNNSFEFIDLTPYFKKDFKENQQRFEFKEDGHWNSYAHSLVCDVLFQYLKNHQHE